MQVIKSCDTPAKLRRARFPSGATTNNCLLFCLALLPSKLFYFSAFLEMSKLVDVKQSRLNSFIRARPTAELNKRSNCSPIITSHHVLAAFQYQKLLTNMIAPSTVRKIKVRVVLTELCQLIMSEQIKQMGKFKTYHSIITQ